MRGMCLGEWVRVDVRSNFPVGTSRGPCKMLSTPRTPGGLRTGR